MEISRDEKYMKIALDEAKKALEKGNYPIGAVLVINDEIIEVAGNNIHAGKSWISHAENTLLMNNSEKIRDAILPSIHDNNLEKPTVEIFTTLEPCLMCLGSAVIHRVSRIVYGCKDPHGGASEIESKEMKDWYKDIWPEIMGGVCGEESYNLMLNYLSNQEDTDWIRRLKKYYPAKPKIDLHMHSTFSDGELTPEELVDYAISKNIKAIALTDHDEVLGNEVAEKYSRNKDIEFVPGVEITITPPEGVKELHMVGLFIDYNDKNLQGIKEKHQRFTIDTTRKILSKLNELGYDISFEELFEKFGGKLARPFIAKLLIEKYPNDFVDRKDVFNKLLGKDGKAFVRPKGTEMKDAIDMIHDAGGIAIVAHPWYLGENMIKILEEFVAFGGDGIEIDFTPKETISEDTRAVLGTFAKDKELLISGGTDFHKHEEGKKDIGDRGISEMEFAILKQFYENKIQ